MENNYTNVVDIVKTSRIRSAVAVRHPKDQTLGKEMKGSEENRLAFR